MSGKGPLDRWSENDLQKKSHSVPWKAASHGRGAVRRAFKAIQRRI